MRAAPSSRQLAQCAADLAYDRKASDIVVLHIGPLSSVADFFVVCSGGSPIQVSAICERIEHGIRDRYALRPISVEGTDNSTWVVVDYGEIVVHVFQESTRKHYDLERLWAAASRWNYAEAQAKETAGA